MNLSLYINDLNFNFFHFYVVFLVFTLMCVIYVTKKPFIIKDLRGAAGYLLTTWFYYLIILFSLWRYRYEAP